MKNSLQRLNAWEKEVKLKKISKEEFLTSNTAEGFRVTINSTIKLCEYLLGLPEFKYVLTAKVNQDRLEVNFIGFANYFTMIFLL